MQASAPIDTGIKQALISFAALEHRLEAVCDIDGVLYVDDSKATNVDAAIKALTAYPNRPVIMLLGGHDKGTELLDLAKACLASCRMAICYGEAGPRIALAIESALDSGCVPAYKDFAVLSASGMREALKTAYNLAASPDVVLLSPACSSFDEFSSFGERGEVFKAAVLELKNSESKDVLE